VYRNIPSYLLIEAICGVGALATASKAKKATIIAVTAEELGVLMAIYFENKGYKKQFNNRI
jgi:hypothetical protein